MVNPPWHAAAPHVPWLFLVPTFPLLAVVPVFVLINPSNSPFGLRLPVPLWLPVLTVPFVDLFPPYSIYCELNAFHSVAPLCIFYPPLGNILHLLPIRG